MKTWNADDPKASLMEKKRSAIIAAARSAFLERGYAETSMDRISTEAGVGIKTVYRHFENKDDLFSAVMEAACGRDTLESYADEHGKTSLSDPPWFSKAPGIALPMAGVEYLHHALSKEQLDLYRVVTRDAYRFPELGRRYREEVLQRQTDLFSRYLDRWAKAERWKVKDRRRAGEIFVSILRVGLFENALHALVEIEESQILRHARLASANMLLLLQSGTL